VEYTNTFLKLNADVSGYPALVRSPQDEDQYIETFLERRGVRLDRAAIKPNAAKSGIAKICLNFTWSKLTERNNRTKTKMISDPQELCSFLTTPGKEVADLLFASDEVVWASWRYIDEENIPSLSHTNELIGAIVTAGSRLHL
jgi:hypothetical protein